MKMSKISARDLDLEGHDVPNNNEVDTQILLLALKELLDCLTSVSEGRSESAAAEVEQWEGEGYFYLEAPLPSMLDADIDVNIQSGRAFIRMAR